MPTTTVIDTIHHVVYDTVHTSVFDTVHSVSYDTVRVVLDSTFTIDLLNKSQEFYSSSFSWLLGGVTVLVALFVLAMTLAWNKKFDTEVEKMRNKINEEVKMISKKAFEESKNEFEKNVSELSEKTNKMTNLLESFMPRLVMIYLLQAKLSKDINDCLRYCIFAMDAINENFNNNLSAECEIIIGILEKKFDTIYIDVSPELKKIMVEKIECFESLYFEYFVDKSPEEKEKASDFINRINALKTRLE